MGNRITCTIRLYIAGKHPATNSIRIGKCPATVMIAFGGVETGNLKAYEHVRVTGIIRYNGCIFIATHFKERTTLQGVSVGNFFYILKKKRIIAKHVIKWRHIPRSM